MVAVKHSLFEALDPLGVFLTASEGSRRPYGGDPLRRGVL